MYIKEVKITLLRTLMLMLISSDPRRACAMHEFQRRKDRHAVVPCCLGQLRLCSGQLAIQGCCTLGGAMLG